MDPIAVELIDSTVIVVPPSLQAIATYVLLEQEDWFEKELAFWRRWLRPGMVVLDIGANLGVYSLTAARRITPGGRVFAYEPGAEAFALLEQAKALNRADSLELCNLALSDCAREGWLMHGASTELNALAERTCTGMGETVTIATLDAEYATRAWGAPDLVKLDAEGEEERIIAGGRSVFVDGSPLVMFEIKAGNTLNHRLLSVFRDMNYGIYRQLAGEPVLVPMAEDDPLDPFELNLFAAKADRAAALAAEGLLVVAETKWQPDDVARRAGLEAIAAQPFATSFPWLGTLDPAYLDALAGFAVWRAKDRPLTERRAALAHAGFTLGQLCTREPSFARVSTLARIAWEAGRRQTCLQLLDAFITQAMQRPLSTTEPFWPASPRFDLLTVGTEAADWWLASAVELHEKIGKFSGRFAPPNPKLNWLCASPFATAEMHRRRVLSLIVGQRPCLRPELLDRPAPDHRNAHLWASGTVGGLNSR